MLTSTLHLGLQLSRLLCVLRQCIIGRVTSITFLVCFFFSICFVLLVLLVTSEAEAATATSLLLLFVLLVLMDVVPDCHRSRY